MEYWKYLHLRRQFEKTGSGVNFLDWKGSNHFVVALFHRPIRFHVTGIDVNFVSFFVSWSILPVGICILFIPVCGLFCKCAELGQNLVEPVGNGVSFEKLSLLRL